MDPLVPFLLAPPALSLACAIAAVAALARRKPPAASIAWPAVVLATALPLIGYALLLVAHAGIGSVELAFAAGALLCAAGLFAPPPPARRFMFALAGSEVALGAIWLGCFRLLGQSLGRMH